MTSLAPSSSLLLNNDSIDSLYFTWKAVDSLSTTHRRISNRSWRLMNLQVLQQFPSHKISLMHLMLDDIKNGPAIVAQDHENVSPTTRLAFRPRSQPDSPERVYDSFLKRKNEEGSSLTLKAMNDSNIIKLDCADPSSAGTKTGIQSTQENKNQDTGRVEHSRPSLFLTHSSQALLTVRKASSTYNSGEDTSDVSEDESLDEDSENECFGSDYLEHPVGSVHAVIPIDEGNRGSRSAQEIEDEEKSERVGDEAVLNSLNPAETGKNIFYILNSPSPTDKAISTRRQGLLFNNSKDELVSRADLASSVSSLEVSEDDDNDEDEENGDKEAVGQEDVESADLVEEEMRRSMFSTISHNFAGSKLSKSVKSAKSFKSTDTDSEWVSVSSDGDLPETSPIPPPLKFSKRNPLLSSPGSTNKSGRGNLVLKETPGGSFAPRSLLSGLFLNELANNSGKNSIKSENGALARALGGLDSDKTASPSVCASASQLHTDLTQSNPKPILKRSSTTGIISVDRNATKKTMQRPSIILLKRYASLLDMSRKEALHRSPVLYVAEEDAGNELQTGIDGLIVDDKAVDENQFAKQVLSVGLSDFMVVANSTNASSVLQSHIENGLNLDLGQLYHNYQNQVQDPQLQHHHHHQQQQQNLLRGQESRLSTSLSKYSTQSITGNSFKSFLSKSSLNLTSIFGPTKPLKPRLEKRSGSAETVKSATPKSPSKPKERLPSPSIPESPVNNKEGEQVGKGEQGLSRSIKISSFPKKAFEPSVDISNSLKDSLLIDHKLGKIPMPDRVIREDDIFNGEDEGIFLPDSDDYHSKGW